MPPPDTTILRSIMELPDTLRQTVDSLWSSTPTGKEELHRWDPLPGWSMLIFVTVIVGLSAWFYIVRPASANKRRVRRLLSDESQMSIIEMQYDQWLRHSNPYYSTLSSPLRKLFIERVIAFKEEKEFVYHSMEPDERCAVLISAAAVQLTFGLKNFKMSFFPRINVIKRNYKAPYADKVLEGHVDVAHRSINISWKNFMIGYDDYADGENLGLHEMAHAISYDFLYGLQENSSGFFRTRFEEYKEHASPVFKEIRTGKENLLDDYASLNPEEFWAVSVETFFENALEFREKMPALYVAICEVLNQDPLSEERIMNKRQAGLAF